MPNKVVHILLVEDEAAHAELIRRSFASHPEEVRLTVARRLQEARASLAVSPPDLAIIDLLLPDGKGTELVPSDKETARFPIVIMTSHGDEQMAVDALKAGALDYVVKSATTLADMPRIAERALREWGHITARKQAEEELRKLSYAVEQSQSLIIITDLEGTVEYVNPTFTQVTGYLPEEVIGTPLDIPPSAANESDDPTALWSTLPIRGAWQGQWQQTKKNGDSYLESVSISSIRDVAGALTHFLVVKNDITEEIQMRERLGQSEQLASLGTLAAGLAHELSQPLTAIQVSVDSMLYGQKQGWDISIERLTGRLNLISEQCKRAATILEDVRTFAREGITRRGGSGSLQEGLPRVLRMIGAQLQANNIELQHQIPAELGKVTLHQTGIEQVLINLLTNARQALSHVAQPEKTIVLTASQDATEVVLRVEDNGPGIAPETRARIFAPFFTTKEPGEGMGLGLSIVHGIITEAGGEITVTERDGEGTVFLVRLPRREEA